MWEIKQTRMPPGIIPLPRTPRKISPVMWHFGKGSRSSGNLLRAYRWLLALLFTQENQPCNDFNSPVACLYILIEAETSCVSEWLGTVK